MTSSRTELLRLIAELSDAAPDLRLGQMLTNLTMLSPGPNVMSVWDCEDDEFVTAAQRLLEILNERRAAIANLERTIAAL